VPAARPRPAAAADDLDGARQVVRTVVDTAVEEVVAADVSQEERIARFRRLFDRHFDLPAIARFVLGRYWRTASEAERERFMRLFGEVNLLSWSRRFDDYQGQAVEVRGAQPDGENGALVETVIRQPGQPQPLIVNWRLRKRAEGWKIVDLVVEGISMALTFQRDYASVISQSGGSVTALNDRLQSQAERLRQSGGG